MIKKTENKALGGVGPKYYKNASRVAELALTSS